MTVDEYADWLANALLVRGTGWRLSRIANTNTEYEDKKFEHTLAYLGLKPDDVKESVEDIRQRMANDTRFNAQLRILAEHLHSDLKEFTGAPHAAGVDASRIHFLPSGYFNGFCLNKDAFKQPLDGYLIGLNEGLYFSLEFLAKAYVVESVSGDYEAYRQDATYLYLNAINLYSRPDTRILNDIFFKDVSARVDGQLSAAQSAIAIKTLQFVVLHEFGHIANRDLDLLDRYNLYMSSPHADAAQEIASATSKAHWQAEFQADEFALSTLCRNSSSHISAWANFMGVYLMFAWFSHVEQLKGAALSSLHPPPDQRAARLLEYMKDNIGLWDDMKVEIDKINALTEKWYTNIQQQLARNNHDE